jgi:putative DNA-invertase from lambdoid prophage Rac
VLRRLAYIPVEEKRNGLSPSFSPLAAPDFLGSQNTPENRPAGVVFPLRTANSGADAPADKNRAGGGRRTVLYARVSTADQTLAHQREQAEAAGFHLDEVVADHGVSGVGTKLADRPQGKRLFDILRAGDTLVVRWVDRLGRNYHDVTDTIRDFIRRGVIVRTVINKMTFDGSTKDPMCQAVRDALIAFMAATAQAQAEATKEAQRAGIVYAQANDDGTKFRGRKPTFDWPTFAAVRDLLSQGIAVAEIAKTTGLKRQTIYRIQKEPERQATALAAWGPNQPTARV